MDMPDLRRECKHLLVDLDVNPKRKSVKSISEDMGVNYNSLIMALSGYRKSRSSMNLLTSLKDKLESLLQAG